MVHFTEIACPMPKAVSNGTVSYNSTDIGSTAKYTCDQGYRLDEDDAVICGVDGEWTDPPQCTGWWLCLLTLSTIGYSM